jgi:thiol-disulfide isomerase/thioredoxin
MSDVTTTSSTASTVARSSALARAWLLVAVLCLVVVAACSGGGTNTGAGGQSGTADTRYVSGSGSVTTLPPSDRRAAPVVRGKTLDGKQVSLSDFKGRVVVLNVWGSWCPPCRKEAPDLAAASRALRSDRVAFLGINNRDYDPAPARAYVRRFGVPYPSIYDPDGAQLLGFRGTMPLSSFPWTVVIDKQGRVAARVLGPLTKRTVEQLAHDVAESA